MSKQRFTKEYDVYIKDNKNPIRVSAYSKDEAIHQAGFKLSDLVSRNIFVKKLANAYRRRYKKNELWLTNSGIVWIKSDYPMEMIVVDSYNGQHIPGKTSLTMCTMDNELIERLEVGYV